MATQNGTSGLLMACWRMGQAVSLTVVLMSSGCALCDSPYDYDFAAFGGVRDRYDRQHGRVSSILDPADAAGGTKTVAVERSFVPASGFRADGEDYAASEYEPEPDSELPAPSKGEGGTGSSGSAAEGELGPPSEPTPELPPPAAPGPGSGSSADQSPTSEFPASEFPASDVPAPDFPASETPASESPDNGIPRAPEVPGEPEVPAAEAPGELNLDELFPSSAQ